MDPPPANATVSCDASTGQWIPKAPRSTASKGDAGGFIGLGSVKWNTNAASAGGAEGAKHDGEV